jgi:hypothetical protein
MNTIQTFVPEQKRDEKGRFAKFAPSKKVTIITLSALIVLSSFYLNYWLLKNTYNISCGVNGKAVGYFTRKDTCDELANDRTDFLEADREARNLQATLTWDEPIND